jgi:hypothetical protein
LAAVAATFVAALWCVPTATASPCSKAFALAREGHVAAAQSAFVALFGRKNVPACARHGLRKWLRHTSRAGALIHAGFRKEAMTEIKLARMARPGAPMPKELRRFVGAQRRFDRVRALKKAGFRSAAEDTLRHFLKKRPHPAGGIPSDMRSILEPKEHPILHGLRNWFERTSDDRKTLLWIGKRLLWILGVALIVGLVGYFVLREVLRRLWRLRRPRLSISPFAGAGAKDESEISRGFALELQAAIQNLGEPLGGTRPDITLPQKPFELSASVTALPQLGYVQALIEIVDRLLPSNDRELTGYLQPATARGAGATLVLAKESGEVRHQVTLRQADYDAVEREATAGPADFALLIRPATYWVRVAIARRRLRDVLMRRRRQPFSRWQAYALFDAGARAEENGEDEAAMRFYVDALKHEPPLPEALLNLGNLEIRHGASVPALDEIQRGIDHIDDAMKLLRRR